MVKYCPIFRYRSVLQDKEGRNENYFEVSLEIRRQTLPFLNRSSAWKSWYCKIIHMWMQTSKSVKDTAVWGVRGMSWTEVCWGHRAADPELPARQGYICSNKLSFHADTPSQAGFLSAVNVHKPQHFCFTSEVVWIEGWISATPPSLR